MVGLNMKTTNPHGPQASVVIEELGDMLWAIDAEYQEPYHFTDRALGSALKVFTTVLFDKAWEHQEREGILLEDRLLFATQIGEELRELIKKHTGLDSWDLQ